MDTLEIKKVENGFVIIVQGDEYKEYVFVREHQVIKFLKEYFNTGE
jgi:hypothetical protein